MKLLNIMVALLFMILRIQASSPSAVSLGTVRQQVVKRIEQAKFQYQTCDILVMANLLEELELNNDVPVIICSSDIETDQTLAAFQTFLVNHLKCLIVFARYTGNETIQFMDKLLEKKPNSQLVLFGSGKMEPDSTKRWKPIVYINLMGQNDHWGTQQIISLETKCLDSVSFTFDVWNRTSGSTYPESNPFANCKHPFEGRFFMLSAVLFPPCLIWVPPRPPIGTDLLILKIFSEIFKFKFGLKFVSSVETVLDDVRQGGAPLLSEFLPLIGYTTPTYIFKTIFAAYRQLPLSSNNNMLKAFDPLVWGVSYMSLLSVSATFSLIYYVYLYKLQDRNNLVKPIVAAVGWVDFLILPFSKLLEPDPITWFPTRVSSGYLLMQFWSFFTMFLMFFYTSNLQPDLVLKTYEKPMLTLQDVLNRNKPVYIPTGFAALDYKAAAAQGVDISDIMMKISKLAYKTNGYYDIIKYKGKLPPEAIHNVEKDSNGAVYLTTDGSLAYQAQFYSQKNYVPHGQWTKEALSTQLMCFFTKKFSPWKDDIDWTIIRMTDTGIMQKILNDPISFRASIKWTPAMEVVDKEPLKMNQLLLAFYIMGAFYLFSILIFLAELVMGFPFWWGDI